MNIKVISPSLDYSGYAEASRNLLLALDKAGVHLTTVNVHYQSLAMALGEGGQLAAEKENLPLPYDKIIMETTPDNFIKYLEPLKYHIGRFYWETNKLNEVFVWGCNKMEEVWVATPSYKEIFKENGVKVPVIPIPDCVETNIRPYRPYVISPHRGFLFYSMFQWTPRKNPEALLKTYWKTFEGKDDVSLLLKVYRIDFTEAEKQAIRDEIDQWKHELKQKHYPRVFLYLDPMNRDEIMRFHATGDCFVSAHCGEGWGYPQMEAMISGKPIISTNYGGIHEWIDDTVGWLLPYKLIPVRGMNWIPWYDDGQKWADVDRPALAKAMVEAYKDKKETARKGVNAKRMAKKKFSFEAVGKLVMERLNAI